MDNRSQYIADNITAILPLSERGPLATPSKLKPDSIVLGLPGMEKHRRIIAAGYKAHGESWEALGEHAGGGGTVVGDAGPKIGVHVENRHKLAAALDDAEAAVAEGSAGFEAEAVTRRETARERALEALEVVDAALDEIAESEAIIRLLNDRNPAQRAATDLTMKHRPGGDATNRLRSALGAEARNLFYVSPQAFKRLQGGEAAEDVNGERVEALKANVRVRYSVPTSALAGDAPGGAWS
jgi:hypothetical protein